MDHSPQDSLSMGFSRQVYWSGLPFPSPSDLLDPGIELEFPALQANSLHGSPKAMTNLACVLSPFSCV